MAWMTSGRLALMLAAAIGVSSCERPAPAPSEAPSEGQAPATASPEALAEATQALSRDVIAWTEGAPVDETPTVEVGFTFLTTWLDDETDVLHVATWDQVSEGLRAFLGGMVEGSPAPSTQAFYEDFFHRYYVAHEAARFAAAQRGPVQGTPYERQLEANAQAIAYWAAQPDGEAWLNDLFAVVSVARDNLPSPVAEGETAASRYDADPDAVRTDGAAYAWYLMHLAMEAWQARQPAAGATSAPAA